MALKKKKTAPVEEVKENVVDLWAEENEAEMHIESEEKEEFENIFDDEPADTEVKVKVESDESTAEKKWKVEIKEEEYKSVNLLKAPEEIKKIIQFYGLTGKDLFEGKFDGVKEDEAKMLKEWYATLA